ncbi:MAG TPA: hypothetical protein VG778_10585, partial [Blastocatellia bacterium]|nr:hypothetical protein [Blastocatellia bacterium]
VLQPEMMLAQQRPSTVMDDWRPVRAIATASEMVVKLKTGKNLKGNFMGATDDALSLTEKGKISELARADIARVQVVIPRRSPYVGELVGAGGGAAFGVALMLSFHEDETISGWSVVLSGLLFAAIGWAFGRLFSPRHRRLLVYEVR